MTTQIIVRPAGSEDPSTYEFHDEDTTIQTAILGAIEVGRVVWQADSYEVVDLGIVPDLEFPISDLILSPGDPFVITPSLATGDPAPDYARSSGPDWAVIDPVTGEISGTAPANPIDTRVTVRAANTAGITLASVNISVQAAEA